MKYMEQAVYHIKIHSVSRTIIASALILIPALTLLGDSHRLIENFYIHMMMVLVVFMVSYFLASQIGMAKVKIILTATGIMHIWERRFIFSRDEDISIPWEIVDSYAFEESSHFNSFKINFTNNKRYKFYRLNLFPIKDDFQKLLIDFPKLSNELRNALPSDVGLKPIIEGGRIFDYKYIRWFFLLLFALMLVLLITKSL